MDGRIFEMKIRVTQASIDVLEHVNNREYFRWMEEAATLHSEARGWPQERYLKEQHVWVAREHWVEYLRPALLGDEISVYTWIQSISGPVSLRRYAFVREGKMLTRAATEWAHIDFRTKRLSPLPESLMQTFIPVPPDDPELSELGIARPVRWLPVNVSA